MMNREDYAIWRLNQHMKNSRFEF